MPIYNLWSCFYKPSTLRKAAIFTAPTEPRNEKKNNNNNHVCLWSKMTSSIRSRSLLQLLKSALFLRRRARLILTCDSLILPTKPPGNLSKHFPVFLLLLLLLHLAFPIRGMHIFEQARASRSAKVTANRCLFLFCSLCAIRIIFNNFFNVRVKNINKAKRKLKKNKNFT